MIWIIIIKLYDFYPIFVTVNFDKIKMHDTRLVKILKTFSPEEMKEFGKFIASPYFSKGRDLTPLYKELKKFHPEFTGKGLEKEMIFSKLGKGKYNEQLMRIMISDLSKMAVEYLHNLSAMESPLKTKLFLTENALRRRLLFLAEQLIDEAEETMLKSPVDIDRFYNLHGLEMQKGEYNYVTGTTRYKGAIEKNASEYTIFYFLDLAANHLHNFYTYKTNVNIDYTDYMLVQMLETTWLRKLEPLITGSKVRDAARIYLYYILSYIDKNDEHYFYKMKDLLFKSLGELDPSIVPYMLNMYSTLCTKKGFELDYDKFTLERLESKKKMISAGMFTRNPPNFIHPIRFYTVISSGVEAGDHKWVEKMVQKHTDDLAPEYRNSFYNYFMAEVYFLKKDFDRSLSYAGKIDISTFILKPIVYSLQLRLYYELNYIDEALSIIDTFRHFIKGNKQATTIVSKNRTDFLKLYKKLLIYKSGKRRYSFQQLKEEKTDPATLQRKWLMEKLNELR